VTPVHYRNRLIVGDQEIGLDRPTYFIADIASNHDRDLERAKALIWLAKEAGADAAKFQHFKASQLVSAKGFGALDISAAHQDAWGKSVYAVYEENEYQRDWDDALAAECAKSDIHFMTSPYDRAAIDSIAARVAAFKIGSGDITTPEIVERIAEKGKTVFLATGASDLPDVVRAVGWVLARNPALGLMQCNTNYTGSLENLHHINLRALDTYRALWPGMVLGLSDHTPGWVTVLGAVALGARCIEKHFTDDNARKGPDHPFSMNPKTWREMVDRTRELEAALGDGFKRVQDNERETVVVQRRGLHLARDMAAGETLAAADLVSLRPATPKAFFPYERQAIAGRPLTVAKKAGEPLYRSDVAAD
jgi:sialic acid synthase SpsE